MATVKMLQSRMALVVALFALGLLVVQSAAADKLPVKYNAADQAAARAAVLQRRDLEPDKERWKGGARKPDFSETKCAGYNPKRSDLLLTGAAASEWTYPGLSFDSEAWVMQSEKMVRLDWERTFGTGFLRCIREVWSAPNTKVVSLKRIGLPGLAPLSRRYRLLVDYTEQGRTVRLVFDTIFIAKGRTELTLFATAPYAGRQALAAVEVILATTLIARFRA